MAGSIDIVPAVVTGGIAPSSPAPRAAGTLRAAISSPTLRATVAYALVAIGAAVAAYLALFTQFAGYDDEGTLLVTLKAFVHGGVLYRDIYSEYGPFYYELFGGLFSLSGHAVTTNASRSIVIVVWVGASFLFGLSAQRLTGRLALGLAGMIAAFGCLDVLIGEPMHPHGLSVVLLALFTLLTVSGPGRRTTWLGGTCGALLAALILTKVNLGAFAVAAVVLAAVLTVEPLHRRRLLLWPVILAFLALPILITARDLRVAWVHDFALTEILSSVAIVVAAWPGRARSGQDNSAMTRWLLGACAGFALAFVVIVVAILLTGPTLSDLYDGVIRQAIRVRDVLVLPFALPSSAVDWSIAAVAAATLVARLRGIRMSGMGPPVWPGALRILAGVTIWLSVARLAPLSLNPAANNPDSVPLALAWIAAIPPAGPPEPVYKRFLRVLLPALAMAETLGVYPVAGSQMGIAAVAFVAVGALCIGDGIICLRTWSAARGSAALERFGVIASVVAVALVAEFALDSLARPAASNAVAYHDQEALPFPGATQLRLPAPRVETYSRLVSLLHSHRCTTFVGYPNVDSLYLWSGIEAPTLAAPGAWINALESKQQQRIVNALRASPRPCAIRSNALAEAWLHGAPPPTRPLVRYIFDDFRPVETVDEFEFMLPKTRARSR